MLLASGIAATVAFVVIRASGLYGDPNPWHGDASLTRTIIDFLNTTKYPPSLLFLLMTLGPAAILCALAEHVPAWLGARLVTFGRAPFAFYVIHLYLLHAGAILLGVFQGFAAPQFLTVFQFFPGAMALACLASTWCGCSWSSRSIRSARGWPPSRSDAAIGG